jgi:methyl-accepting chemotaxis protein
MKHWTIARRLTIGFTAVLSVTVALGAFSWVEVSSLAGETRMITKDVLPGVQAVMTASALVANNRAAMLEHLAAADPARKAAIEKEMDAVSATLTETYAAYDKTISTDEDRALFATLDKPRAAYRVARAEKFLPLSRLDDRAGAMAVFASDVEPAFKHYQDVLSELIALNRRNGDVSSAAVDRGVAMTQAVLSIGLLIAVLIGAGAAWLIIRAVNKALGSVVSELSEGARQVTSAAGQVATSSQSLSQGATEQAASLEETSASMEEMASMTRQNAANSQTAANLMSEVESKVKSSNQALGDMVASMASIQESSQQVAKIIKTIDEIAFQTNILALNAAVEAARAGEAGMGFAVVADEVRNLAQRSAQAARDTATLIEESIAKADSGNAKVEVVASAISGITESVTRVKGIVEEVSQASKQQSQGIDQVSQAISQMEKVTQTTAATAEESAAASEELSAQAEGSIQVVGRLEALVGAVPATSVPAPTRATKSAARVLRMGRTASPVHTAEDELPMGNTGTYGKF